MGTMSFDSHDDETLTKLLSLAGRTALVTGGARGIGLAICRRLAEAGADVAITDIAGAEEAADSLRGDYSARRIIGLELDVALPDSVAQVVASVVGEFGRLDILVNNAGIFPPAHVFDQPFAQWRSVMSINLDGNLLCSTAAAKPMSAVGRGCIVNVVSTQGLRGATPAMSAYTTSKHALIGLTKALAIDLAPSGIRVMGVAPNVVITPGYQNILDTLISAGMSPDVLEQIKAGTPMGRPVTADEVARGVLFCASDLASAMTGSVITVDTGAMAL